MELERRCLDVFELPADLEELSIREEEGKPRRLVGYAAVYGSLSNDLGGFKERIRPGAFKSALASGRDIRALVGHDPHKLLARTSNGTLRLAEDAVGLRVEIDVPDVSYARDAVELVRLRTMKGMSFGFKVAANGQKFVRENGMTVRELLDIDLREVTVTGNPAYGDTSLHVRVDPEILAAAEKIDQPELMKRKRIFHTIG